MLRTLLLMFACLACTGAFAQTDARAQEYAIILRLAAHYQVDSVWTDADKAAVGEHFAALQKLQQQDKLVFAGRTTNQASLGIIVLKGMSEAEARAVMASDKAIQRGIMIAELQPFYTALK
jgi:uncharacterized protein YciI